MLKKENLETRCCPSQSKNTKPNENENHEVERGDPLCSDIPEWLQEFRENLVDDEIPLQGGSHASSSREVSLEPIFKRREDMGKHSVFSHFPKNRNCEICQRTNSLEFGKSGEDLSWNHCTSTPHRSETVGIAERAVRRGKEGTSAVLLQSGLNESRCADSMECDTYLRNIQDPLSDGKTPYERRFGKP